MGDCQLGDVWAFAVPETASVLSNLPVGCIYSVSPPDVWALWGGMGCWPPEHWHRLHASVSDLLGFTLPLIQARSSFDPYVVLHDRFQGIRIVTQQLDLVSKYK